MYPERDTTFQDTPEYADLSANLSACRAHLEFLDAIPSVLGDMTSSTTTHTVPSIEALESTPVAPLVAAHPSYKMRPSLTQPSKSIAKPAETKKTRTAKTKTANLPRSVAALPAEKRPIPDPERWLPKRERKGYAAVLAQREKEKEKKRLKARKKLEATMTQGSAEGSGPVASDSKSSHVPRTAGSNKTNKKKKGGK